MKLIVFAGIFALSASTALAQTNAAPEPIAPEPIAPEPIAPAPETGSPTAPSEVAPIDPAAGQQASTAGPANICEELFAFMEAPPPEAAAPAAEDDAEAAEETTQEEQAAAEQEEASAGEQEEASAGEDASALAGTTSADVGASAEPERETNSAQQVTGQDGVASDAPEPSNEKVASGSVANAPQKESRAAPLPTADVTSTPKESVVTVEQAEELAAANDIAQCQSVAREMRVAGVSMPPPLIALAALDLQYQQGSDTGTPPSDIDNPAASEQDPGSETQQD